MSRHDVRNREVLHYVDGRFVRQYEDALPLFDSGFLHGKQVWSSPRLVNGRIFQLEAHLEKIIHSAELNHFPDVPGPEVFIAAIRETLRKNEMFDGVHVRVLLTAGSQVTASMDLAAVVDWDGKRSKPRILVMPEYRDDVYDAEGGIRLVTSRLKRPAPDLVDQASHDNNQNASSRALYEAKAVGATSSLIYGSDGYLAEAPASHVAIVKDGRLETPFVRCCPPGITRRVILDLCADNGIPATEADLEAAQVAKADEVFLMGTMSGPVGATQLDGQPIGDGTVGPITRKLRALYQAAVQDPANGYDMNLRPPSAPDQNAH